LARRRLLTDHERRCLFEPPTDDIAIIANYTLSAEDIEVIGRRYGAPNRLGLASHIALMRHLGFGLPGNNAVPTPVLHYLAAQLHVDPAALTSYGQRSQTRNDHAEIVARYLGLHPFRRMDIPFALELAEAAARHTDRGEPIVRALIEGLKDKRFILPASDTLERAGLAGRARARKAAAAALIETLDSSEMAHLDDLIVNNSDFGMTPLGLAPRNFEEAPTTANINGLLGAVAVCAQYWHRSRSQLRDPRIPLRPICSRRRRGPGLSPL
jgi:hypothetical protein